MSQNIAAVVWLKYCRFGVKPYKINQSENIFCTVSIFGKIYVVMTVYKIVFKIKIKWIVTYSMLYRQRLTFSTVEPFVPSIAAIHTRSINVMALFRFQTIATRFGAVFSKHPIITFWNYTFIYQLLLKVWLVCIIYNPVLHLCHSHIKFIYVNLGLNKTRFSFLSRCEWHSVNSTPSSMGLPVNNPLQWI